MTKFKIRGSAGHLIMGEKGIGQTGTNYCEEWLKTQPPPIGYGRGKTFTSKYTDNGNQLEGAAVKLVIEQLGLDLYKDVPASEIIKTMKLEEKAQVSRVNDYFTGTIDLNIDPSGFYLEDTKVSWGPETFPLYQINPSKQEYWQAQIYMELFDRPGFRVHKCLMDKTDEMITREAMRMIWDNERSEQPLSEIPDELTEEFFESVKAYHTYSNLPIQMRYKTFEIKKDTSAVARLIERVVICRSVIEQMLDSLGQAL